MVMFTRIALAVSLSAFAAGTVHAADVVVSSKIDTEGTLLGNVIALALNANGIKTKDRIALGGNACRAQGDHRRRDRHLS
jgi:osmoprotectant transport system substrate-binding protein